MGKKDGTLARLRRNELREYKLYKKFSAELENIGRINEEKIEQHLKLR